MNVAGQSPHDRDDRQWCHDIPHLLQRAHARFLALLERGRRSVLARILRSSSRSSWKMTASTSTPLCSRERWCSSTTRACCTRAQSSWASATWRGPRTSSPTHTRPDVCASIVKATLLLIHSFILLEQLRISLIQLYAYYSYSCVES